MKNKIVNEYFDWMYRLVCKREYTKGGCYRKLMHFLHDTEFTYTVAMDGNRAEDGTDLRYRFGDERGFPPSVVASFLDQKPCSVLEMMAALAIRCEEHIMDNPDIGNRTGQWFWDMIINLGLDEMTDENFDQAYVEKTVRGFLGRKYKRNGEGGLFVLRHGHMDMRPVEIWYQAMRYLGERV